MNNEQLTMNKEKTAQNKARRTNNNFVICSLLFVICLASCGGEETELYTAGRLTITGLDTFNDQEIFAHGTSTQYGIPTDDIKLDAYGRVIGHNAFSGKIASNQATLNIYNAGSSGGNDIHGTEYRNWSNYNGNDQNIKFAVAIVGKAYGYVTVNFTNGIASGAFEKAPFIDWYLNGGSKGTGTYPWQIEKNKALYKPSPDPTKADYLFGGWFTDSALTQEYNFTNAVTADLSLYAKWEWNGPPVTDFTFELITSGNNADTYRVRKGRITEGVIVIPSSYNDLLVTEIGSSAFANCTGLTSVTIPASVTSIGTSAFSNCTGLASITIPASVTEIGSQAFNGCASLTSITIPTSVTSIGDWVFYYCAGLTSVTIPTSVTSIGISAFSHCTGLTSVTIPTSVTTVGLGAFSYCTGLTSVTINEGVTTIGGMAFMYCTNITSITIPASVTTVGLGAFFYWTSSQTINVPWTQGNKPNGWDSVWDSDCNAQIVYQQ